MIILIPENIPPKDLSDAEAVLIASNVPETDAGEDEWDPNVEYSIGDIVSVLGDVQRRFESLTDENEGNNPADSPAEWLDLGATNRWRMFDGGTSTLTTNDDVIDITFSTKEFVNSVSFFNTSSSKIRIIVTPEGESEPIFDQEQEFLLGISESNWWSWFFGRVIGIEDALRDHVVLTLPQLFRPTIRIIMERPAGVVKAGLIVFGRQQPIGVGIYGSTVGIRDFSTKEFDVFGNARIVERRFAKRAELDIYVETQKVPSVQRALASRRAKPTVYVGSPDACMFCADPIHEELLIYGFFVDFDIVLNDRLNSSGTIDLEGL